MKKSLLMLLITFAWAQANVIEVNPLSDSPFAAGNAPYGVSYSPDGKFLAVANNGSDDVSVFSVAQKTGSLTEIAGSPFIGETTPRGLAYSPDGLFLAVTNGSGNNNVTVFEVDQATGALSEITGSPFSTGAQPQSLSYSPDGSFLAVANINSGTITVFDVNQTTGFLTEITGSPFSAGGAPQGVAYSPDGSFLSVTTNADSVTVFDVNQTTGFLTGITGSPFGVGTGAEGLSYSPDGSFLAVANNTSDTITVFDVNQTTGFLTEITGSPFGATGGPNDISYSPDGLFLATSLRGAGEAAFFAIDQTTGALTPVTDSPFVVGSDSMMISYFPNGNFLAVSNNVTNGEVIVFKISYLQAGSDTQVQLFQDRIILANQGIIDTFAVMDGGFLFMDDTTQATYNSTFPVKEDVSLEGGTLVLDKDLTLVGDGRIESMGTIDGQDHTLTLAPGTSLVPQPLAGVLTRAVSTAPCFEWGDMTLTLNSDVTFEDTCITFTGNSVINGQGHVLTIGDNSTFQIGQNSTLLMTNVIVEGIETGKVVPLDATSILTLQNTEWLLDDTYSFTQGTLNIEKQVTITGKDWIFSYESDQVSIIGKNARLQLNNGLIFNYDPSAGPDRLQLLTNNSTIFLNGATLQASDVGLQLIKGILQVGRKSFVSSAGSDMATGIRFGDGMDSANNLTIDILPAAQLELLDGFIVENNA